MKEKVAKHLKVGIEDITTLQEWKTVFFTVIKGKGGRFVSKRAVYETGNKFVFKRILKSKVCDWNLFDLKLLKKNQLQTLCILLGVAKSGNKDEIITRLKKIISVRVIIDRYSQSDENHFKQAEIMAQDFKHRELKVLCRKVRTFAPGTKYGMAISLTTWRLNAIARGKRAFDQTVAEIKARRAAAA